MRFLWVTVVKTTACELKRLHLVTETFKMNSGENNKDTAFPSKLKTIVTMEKAILTQHHTLPLTLKPN